MSNKKFVGAGLAVGCTVIGIISLSGCGGGSSGGGVVTPTATPVATSTPVATATPTSGQNLVLPVTFDNFQNGTLNLRVNGTSITGTLTVKAPGAASVAKRAFTFSIPVGTFNVTGTFAPPRGFGITGTFPAPINTFTISGTIPTQTEAGSFTIKAANQTATGTIPPVSTIPTPIPTVTPTPGATSTPTPTVAPGGPTPTPTKVAGNGTLPTGGNGQATLTLAGTGSGDNAPFVSNAGTFAITQVPSDTDVANTVLTFKLQNTGQNRVLNITVVKKGAIVPGDTFSFDSHLSNGNGVIYNTSKLSRSGTLRINSATPLGFTFTISNLVLGPLVGDDTITFSSGSGTGAYN